MNKSINSKDESNLDFKTELIKLDTPVRLKSIDSNKQLSSIKKCSESKNITFGSKNNTPCKSKLNSNKENINSSNRKADIKRQLKPSEISIPKVDEVEFKHNEQNAIFKNKQDLNPTPYECDTYDLFSELLDTIEENKKNLEIIEYKANNNINPINEYEEEHKEDETVDNDEKERLFQEKKQIDDQIFRSKFLSDVSNQSLLMENLRRKELSFKVI